MNQERLAVIGEAICPYCGVGCRLRVEGRNGRPERIRGVEDAPANLGRLCAKGATLHEALHTPDRLLVPMWRRSRQEDFRPADWPQVLRYVAECLRSILHAFGPNGIAFYGSGQLDTETAYLACKLFKGYSGTNNTDSNSRLCMAAAVAGYRTSLGSDGPPCCYEDIDHADVIFIIGSDMAECHPVTFDWIRAAKKRRPELTIVVADPRRTATAREADIYLPVAPGGDIALLNALGRLLLEYGAVNETFVRQHTRGFEEYRQFPLEQNLEELCQGSGMAETVLRQVAHRIAQARAFLSFYCMGLNQSTVGMWKNNSLLNLRLLTGQIGQIGAGPFSLTGQPNAMGGREAGLLSHQLPGYRFVEDTDHRREVEQFWDRPAGTIQPRPRLTAVEMFRALEKGQLQAIWIAGTNPLVSLPDLHQVRRAVERAQLVIVQDAYHSTETTHLAHVLLPAAQWGEKEWTSTSSERLVSYSPKLFDPPGHAIPDWQILARFAEVWGFRGFAYASAAEVWDEFRQLTRGRPCDMFGITTARLRQQRHVYWPCPHEDHIPVHYGAILTAFSQRPMAKPAFCLATTEPRANWPTMNLRSSSPPAGYTPTGTRSHEPASAASWCGVNPARLSKSTPKTRPDSGLVTANSCCCPLAAALSACRPVSVSRCPPAWFSVHFNGAICRRRKTLPITSLSAPWVALPSNQN